MFSGTADVATLLFVGVYKVTPRSCHQFEQDYYTYSTYVYILLTFPGHTKAECLMVPVRYVRNIRMNVQWQPKTIESHFI